MDSSLLLALQGVIYITPPGDLKVLLRVKEFRNFVHPLITPQCYIPIWRVNGSDMNIIKPNDRFHDFSRNSLPDSPLSSFAVLRLPLDQTPYMARLKLEIEL